MSNEKPPVHEIRLGKCKAVIWLNQTDVGPRYNVSFSRIYKTDKGWESSSSFGRDELPLVAKVADKAHTWIFEQSERSDTRQSASGNTERQTAKASS